MPGKILVIDSDGSRAQVMKIDEALALAREKSWTWLTWRPTNVPVCRLMDYGKYKYEQSKREREARKHQKMTTIKETKVRPNIEKHDLDVKTRRAALSCRPVTRSR